MHMKKQGTTPADRRHGRYGKETGGCMALPFPLGNFPGIPVEYVEVLRTKRILDTAGFLKATPTAHDSVKLASSTGIPAGRIREIRALCDLARIRGVGAETARVLYHAGIRSTDQLAESDAALLYRELNALPGAYKDVIRPMQEKDLRESIECARFIIQREHSQREHV